MKDCTSSILNTMLAFIALFLFLTYIFMSIPIRNLAVQDHSLFWFQISVGFAWFASSYCSLLSFEDLLLASSFISFAMIAVKC